MLRFLAGFCSATVIAVAVYFLKSGDNSPRIADIPNIHDPLFQISQHEGAFTSYRLGVGGYFHGGFAHYPTLGPFRVVHLDPALEIQPSDIEKICFNAVDQDENGTLHLLQVSVFLAAHAAQEFTETLQKHEDRELSFEIGPFKITNFQPNATSIWDHIEAMEYRNTDGSVGPDRFADFSLTTNHSVPALMHVVKTLSPDTVPDVCTPSVTLDNIKQWKEITSAFWGKKKRYL